jgi:hypothetical protein
LPRIPKAQFWNHPHIFGKLAYARFAFRKTLTQDRKRLFVHRHFQGESSMLRHNPLQPPRPFTTPASGTTGAAARGPSAFVSAEDFDGTGILAGIDLCESRYWWMPELYGPEGCGPAAETMGVVRSGPLERVLRHGNQAARRAASRSTAAA